MWVAFATAVQAGTLSFHASSPVGLKLDSDWVSHAQTDATVLDVAPGMHRVEVCDLFGKTIAFEDIRFDDGPVRLIYEAKGLRRVSTEVDSAPLAEQPQLDADGLLALKRDLIKASDRKRLQKLTEALGIHWFTMVDVDGMVGTFLLSDRLDAARALAPWTLDPQNARTLEHHFPDGSRKAAVVALFEST